MAVGQVGLLAPIIKLNQMPIALYWARDDLRLADNPALSAASESGLPVVALYILDDETAGRWKLGAAARWWLDASLRAFGESLSKLNITLILRRGNAAQLLQDCATQCHAQKIYWNRRYTLAERSLDQQLKSTLKQSGFEVHSYNGSLLAEPWEIKTASNSPYKVYSPFLRAVRIKLTDITTAPPPQICPQALIKLKTDTLDDWLLKPKQPNWAASFTDIWRPGEAGARDRLESFCQERMSHYAVGRDIPSQESVSRLSPHLRFGEISVRQTLKTALNSGISSTRAGADKFASEIIWREFAHHLLYHFSDFPDENWRSEFDSFPWAANEAHLSAWRQGRTGYPLVDAGMRELWATGYMHNRVRMVAASFLTKHLLIDWRRGEEWFWDTLVDADLANNSVSWQWVAGSGADAAPYFRIFNPVAQGERFDPEGAYVRRWVPELVNLPNRYIHAPWLASEDVLSTAHVKLGDTYPAPIIDHAYARERALVAYKAISKSNSVGNQE